MTGRTTESGAKTLKVLFALKGCSISGLTNGDIAKGLNESPSTVNRILNTMIKEGAAVKLENGSFALSIKILQIAQAHANEIKRASELIDHLQQRVQAGSHL